VTTDARAVEEVLYFARGVGAGAANFA
jgi:hypothetical protein